jgi:uncharacterized protein YybS (DUF2232 family)
VMTKQFPIVINSLLVLLLLYYASIQLPVLGLVIGALMPLPIIMTIRRAGWLPGLLMVTAGLGMLFYVEHFAGIKAEVLPLLQMAVIGFAIAFFSARHYRLEVIVGAAVALAVTFQVGVFLILAWQQGVTPLAYLQQTVAEIWTMFSQLVEKEPLLQQEIQLTGVKLAEFTAIIAQLTPAFLVINSTLVVLLNYLLSQNLGSPLASEDRRPPLTSWEAPGWLVFVLIGAGFLVLIPNRVVQMTGVNVLLVCGLLYFFQGLAILTFNFKRFQVPRIFRWLAYFLLVMLKPAMLLVILMGLIDLWLDFRRLHRPPSEA